MIALRSWHEGETRRRAHLARGSSPAQKKSWHGVGDQRLLFRLSIQTFNSERHQDHVHTARAMYRGILTAHPEHAAYLVAEHGRGNLRVLDGERATEAAARGGEKPLHHRQRCVPHPKITSFSVQGSTRFKFGQLNESAHVRRGEDGALRDVLQCKTTVTQDGRCTKLEILPRNRGMSNKLALLQPILSRNLVSH